MKEKDVELMSLNNGLLQFELSDVSAEQLEHRLELAIGALVSDGCSCPNLTSCGAYCNGQSGN